MNRLLIILSRLFAALPRNAAARLGSAMGFFVGRILRPRRGLILQTLAERLPETSPRERRRIVDGLYRGLALNAVEILRIAGGKMAETVAELDVTGEEHVQKALAGGRGALLLTAHLGNWDLLGMAAPRFGYPLTFISKNIKISGLNKFWMRIREEAGVRILPPHNSYRDCLKVLRRNELLGFILDVNRPRSEAVFVDFFGIPAATTPGLAFLAAQSGAPVLPVFIRRTQSGRHEIRIHPALPAPPDRSEASIREATQHYTRAIEEEIRRRPEDWLWLHRRWKTRPDPDAPGQTTRRVS